MPKGSKAKTKLGLREVLAGVVVIAIAGGLLLLTNQGGATATIEGTSFSIDVADDMAERQQGLSGRAKLDESEGMLFVFDEPGVYGFWMKDMNFSIDMLWLNSSGEIVFIEESVPADSYPEVFYPSVPADYVLEISAGLSAEAGFDVGDVVDIHL